MAVVQVVREVFSKCFNECFVVSCGVEFFCTEELGVFKLPCSFQHLYIEERLKLRGDVFEERENPVVGVLVAKSVEDEAVFGYKRVSVHRSPFNFSRVNTPRNRVKLKTKKAMRSDGMFCLKEKSVKISSFWLF